jgi:hypothetical protein
MDTAHRLRFLVFLSIQAYTLTKEAYRKILRKDIAELHETRALHCSTSQMYAREANIFVFQ